MTDRTSIDAQAQAEARALRDAVSRLRDEISRTRLPLDLPGADDFRGGRGRLLNQLDDYLLPRLDSLDAPLLAVIGGSTGSGKSTLVNSLIGSAVSTPGVLRPTTRSPVLVCNTADTAWFTDHRILPGLARVTRGGTRATTTEQPGVGAGGAVEIVATEDIPEGLALLDAPDIDSVVEANRSLAQQLLQAADLWLFVTTAARYADAVPWGLLTEAAQRGTSIAIVLDRTPESALDDVAAHLRSMLVEHRLDKAPLFTIPEATLGPDGMLPHKTTEPLRHWLGGITRDARARAAVVQQTLMGALESLGGRTGELLGASDRQVAAMSDLAKAVDAAYGSALEGVVEGTSDGTLLRGEILARWQEFVGTGELFRQIESGVSRLRDRLTSMVKGEPSRTQNLGEALQSGVADLVRAHLEDATAGTARSWRALPGGSALVAAHPELARPATRSTEAIDRLVRDWQGDILDMVRSEGKDRRTTARVMAYGVNGLGVVLMLVTFASTAGLTGAEVGIAGGTAVLGQKILEAVFGDQAVRELARKARQRLVERVEQVYAADRQRWFDVLDGLDIRPDQSAALRTALEGVTRR